MESKRFIRKYIFLFGFLLFLSSLVFWGKWGYNLLYILFLYIYVYFLRKVILCFYIIVLIFSCFLIFWIFEESEVAQSTPSYITLELFSSFCRLSFIKRYIPLPSFWKIFRFFITSCIIWSYKKSEYFSEDIMNFQDKVKLYQIL